MNKQSDGLNVITEIEVELNAREKLKGFEKEWKVIQKSKDKYEVHNINREGKFEPVFIGDLEGLLFHWRAGLI